MSTPATINLDTLRLLLEHTRGTPAEQLKLGESLDSKTVQIAAAASIVIGFMSVAPQQGVHLPWGVVLAAVCSYAAVIVSTIYGLWVRKFSVADDPSELWAKLWDEQPEVAMHSIIESLSVGYPDNEALLDGKRWALTFALVGVGVEVVLVGAALIAALTT